MSDKEKESPLDRYRRVLRGVLGAIGVGYGAGEAQDALGRMTHRNLNARPFSIGQDGRDVDQAIPAKSPNFMQLDVEKLRNELKRTGVSVPVRIGQSSRTSFDRNHDPQQIHLNTASTPMAFHEIGHAASEKPFHAMRSVLHTKRIITRDDGTQIASTSVGDGLRLGFMLGALDNPTKEHKGRKFLHDNAALLTGITEIPILMSELRASYSALKGMHAQGGRAAVMGGMKVLGPALGGYLAESAGHVGAVALARHLAAPGHEKTAADAGPPPLGAGAAKAPTLGVPKMPAQPKVTGALRLSTTAANATPVGQLKPKTTPAHPGTREGNFPGIPAAKPPSLTGFYKDTLDSMDAPSRGTRT